MLELTGDGFVMGAIELLMLLLFIFALIKTRKD